MFFSIKRNPRTSIRVRAALSIGAISVAVTLILSLVAGQIARQQIEQKQGETLTATAGRIMETLDQGMFERYREIQLLAALSDIRDPAVNKETKRRLLERVQGTHGHHAWIGIAGTDGIARVGTQGYLETRDVSKRPWFKNGLAGPYVGDVHDALLLAKLLPNPSGDDVYLLDVAAPITGPDGITTAVICSHLHWRWTREALKSIPAESGIEVFLLSRDELVLEGPGYKIFDHFEGGSPIVEKALREMPSGYYLADWKTEHKYLTAHVTSQGYHDYPGLGWRLVLRQDTRTAFASAAALQQRIFMLGLALGAIFTLLGWWIAGRLTRTVEIITQEAEIIGAGDLEHNLPLLGGRDEIGRLSRALNRMLERLRNEISTRRSAEEKVRLAATVFETSVEGILISDRENHIVSVNQAFCKITGYAEDEVMGQNPSMLNSGRNDPGFYQAMWRSIQEQGQWQGEIWNRRKSGEVYPEWLTITMVKDETGQPSHYVAVFSDITERKQAEARIRFLANHDALTSLPNRNLLHDRFDHALARAQRMETGLALIFLDLDRFKDINDTLGHQVGDALLQKVGENLQACLRPGDTLARQGGDEFVALLEDIHQANDVAAVLENILASFTRPISVDGHSVTITPSLGIALYPEDGTDMDTLVKHADIAMYRAKEVGRNNYQFYLPALNERMVKRLDLEARLRQALEENCFELHYQPQVDVGSGRIVGAEALLRWHDAERGNIAPAEFIPLAEETDIIVPLGDWVLRTAAHQAARWAEAGIPVRVAVNISARQLRRHDLASHVGQILAETRLKPSLLEIELTEGVILAASENERLNLEQLQRLGLDISLDDFGTGYSSLSYLHDLRVDSLKIDRSFIANLHHNDSAKLTEIIVMMAKSLGLSIVAEGVETEAQLNFIRSHGVDIYQGWLFSKAVPAADFEHLLRHSLLKEKDARP